MLERNARARIGHQGEEHVKKLGETIAQASPDRLDIAVNSTANIALKTLSNFSLGILPRKNAKN